MPLVVGGHVVKEPPRSTEAFLDAFPPLKSSAVTFTSQAPRVVGPDKFLYVNQREFAVVKPSDECVKVMGTDDATTCHMLVIRHTGDGMTGLSHLDGCSTRQGLSDMMQALQELTTNKHQGRYEVHIFGGFLDDRGSSEELSIEAIGELMRLPQELHLVTFAATGLNDTVRSGQHYPIIYGIAVEVESGAIYGAMIADKGPDLAIRSACHFTGKNRKVMNIYDGTRQQLVIGPFDWCPEDAGSIGQFQHLPDAFIRRYLSTSPAQEPAHFEQQVRASIEVIVSHPQPEVTLFPGGRPITYQRDRKGHWCRVST